MRRIMAVCTHYVLFVYFEACFGLIGKLGNICFAFKDSSYISHN